MPHDFTKFKWVELAREIAIGLHEVPVILARFGLSVAQYEERLRDHDVFQQLVAHEKQLWESALNTPERVKVEAASMFEQFMPTLNTRMHSNNEMLNHVVEAGKLIARAAGIGEDKRINDPGEKYTIHIHVGSKQVELKDVTPVDVPLVE